MQLSHPFNARWIEIGVVTAAAGVLGLLFRLLLTAKPGNLCPVEFRKSRRSLMVASTEARRFGIHRPWFCSSFDRKPVQTVEGWQFPVKASCLLVSWTGFAAGIGAVAFAGRHLLASAAEPAHWIGWAAFALGFALVLLILAKWPEPLILDSEGLLKRGCPQSRIRWQELSHARHYQVRRMTRWDRGVVIHNVYGKQLVVAERIYSIAPVLDSLLDHCPVPVHSLEDAAAPIPIFKARIPKPE